MFKSDYAYWMLTVLLQAQGKTGEGKPNFLILDNSS